MKRYLLNLLSVFLLLGLCACEGEEQTMDSALQPLRIRAELSSSAFTRTESREDDGFTVLAFTN